MFSLETTCDLASYFVHAAIASYIASYTVYFEHHNTQAHNIILWANHVNWNMYVLANSTTKFRFELEK